MTNRKPDSLTLGNMYDNPQQIVSIFYWFIALILLGLVAGVLIVLSNNNIFPATVTALSMLPVLASLYLVRRQKFELAATFLAIVLVTVITITATDGLGIHHISVLGYPAILIIASLVTRKRTMAFITLYTLSCAAWLVFGELSGAYAPRVLVQSVPGDFFSVAIILMLTAVMVRLITDAMFQSSTRLHKELQGRKLVEEKYRNIFDNAIDGIFQSTPDGRFVNVNPAMARMYGYESPEAMMANVADITTQIYVDPHDRDELRRRLDNGEKVREFEMLDQRKDGSTFWTSMNVQAIADDQHNILYYEGTIEDITRRKMADEALRASEEQYRTLFNGMLDGIYRSTHDGKFLDVNPAMVRMFGYETRAEMLALDIKKEMYFAPEDRVSLFLDAGQEKVDVFRMKRKDGSEIWVEDHGRYVQDQAGNILFHEGTLRDITPRLVAEQERQQAENALLQFKNIMDESNDAVFMIDPMTSRYQYFNRRACTMLGYDPSELGELTVVDIATHVTDLDLWRERVALVRANNGLIFDTRYRRKDGSTLPVEVSARALEYGNGETIVAFVRDITERRQAEHEREELIAELETRNNELTQFTYTVSHDLKSPLVTINGFLGFLEQDAASGNMERLKQDMFRIHEAVNKMHALLTELLELSRIGRMMNAPEEIPFHDLIHDALEIVHGRLDSTRVTVQTQPDLPSVHGDRQRLTEVLQNLLDNAAKYMGAQPSPLIEIGQRGMEDGKPIFYVKDNGIGIAPEYHERIFGLFNKLDPKSEGTGIGLALVKKIIEVHGGRLWVESEAGNGSTFYFTLPSGLIDEQKSNPHAAQN